MGAHYCCCASDVNQYSTLPPKDKRSFLKQCRSQVNAQITRCESNQQEVDKDFLNVIRQVFSSFGNQIDEVLEEKSSAIAETFDEMVHDTYLGFLDTLFALISNVEASLIDVNYLYEALRSLPILQDVLPESSTKSLIMPAQDEHKFHNWALTQIYKPDPGQLIYVSTRQQIIDTVLKAKRSGKKVRCAAYAHSFSPIFGDADNYTIVMIPYDLKTKNIPFEPAYNEQLTRAWNPEHELMYIEYSEDYQNGLRIGAATPNWMYYEFMERRLDKGMDILSEFDNVGGMHQTFVGILSAGSHGAEFHCHQLCDYLLEMKLIDGNGEEKVYNKENMDMRLVAVNLGLLGVITEITLQFDSMYTVSYYSTLLEENQFFAGDHLAQFLAHQDHALMFWFPMSKYVECKVWKKRQADEMKEEELEIYPSDAEKAKQRLALKLIELMALLATPLLSQGNDSKSTKLYVDIWVKFYESVRKDVINANASETMIHTYSLHGIHKTEGVALNKLARDFSMAFPLKVDQDGKIDTLIANRLFKAAIDLFKSKAENGVYPYVSAPILLRVKKGSESKLALTYGMQYACIIEFGCDLVADAIVGGFYDYASELCTRWFQIYQEYDADSVELIKTHWAKNFSAVNFILDEKQWNWIDWIKHTRKKEIHQFNQLRQKMDPDDIFTNKMVSQIFSAD